MIGHYDFTGGERRTYAGLSKDAALEKWLEGRPEVVKKMARRYPPGTRFLLHGKIMHVIAYSESGGLSVTPVDPDKNWDKAVKKRRPVCACCVDKLAVLLQG